MSRALLIHFLGFYAIDALMPSWVVSADADVLAVWYASFAIVDLIALMHLEGTGFWRKVSEYGIGTSMAWSIALTAEMLMRNDVLQPSDETIQGYLDVILGTAVFFTAVQWGERRHHHG